jgi:hypothetical protein
MKPTHRFAAVALVPLVGWACGTQATDEYLGEPLLSMRGVVSTDSSGVTADSIPALCFIEPQYGVSLRIDRLPDAIREDIDNILQVGGEAEAHILDVEARGQFPAEFDIEVFTPPPSAALSRLFGGEPKAAFGRVCAVTQEHPAKGQQLSTLGISDCDKEPPHACVGRTVRMTRDGSRYYSEHHDCPALDAPVEACEVTSEGDPRLLAATGGFEHVYGVDERTHVVYLAEPAPAGSYTAYLLAAPDGLDAGYHVRSSVRALKDDAPESCFLPWVETSIAEANAELGTSYEDFSWRDTAGNQQWAPPEFADAYRRIAAMHQMAACPPEHLAAAELPPDSLSIELRARDARFTVERLLAPQP